MENETHFELSDDLGDWVQSRTGDFLARDETQEYDSEPPTSGVLTAFFITCEWVGDDGERWLTYHRKNGQPQWLSRGILSEAIDDL